MKGLEQLLTVRECAARCRTSVDYVRARIRTGELRALRMGRGYRVPVDALEAFLASRTVVIAAAPVADGVVRERRLAAVPGSRRATTTPASPRDAQRAPVFRSARDAKVALLGRRGGLP